MRLNVTPRISIGHGGSTPPRTVVRRTRGVGAELQDVRCQLLSCPESPADGVASGSYVSVTVTDFTQ